MSLHKILVPVNYSKCSINGLLYAAHLAKELNAKILILHALNNNNVASDAQIQTEIQRNKDKINMYCQDEPCLKDIMTDIFISTHSAKKAIKNAVSTYDINLIVMGTEGVKKPMKELVGSLTYHIIEKSEIPVLAIPNSTGYKPIDLIGYGVDYERVYDTRSLSVLKDFAYSFKSRLEIFHIRKYGDASRFLEPHEKAKLDGYFKGLTHEFEIIESDSIPDGLYEYVRKSNPSLVVLVPRKYPFFEWLDHESLSEEAVQHLKIPVLTIPE